MISNVKSFQRLGLVCQVAGSIGAALAALLGADVLLHPPLDYPHDKLAECYSHLETIGFAFKSWANDHQDEFPFNVTTHKGGTRELCARGPGEFDANATIHFQVLSNELSNPDALVCPNDSQSKAAANFQVLGRSNVTYRLRSGPSVNDTNGLAVLAVCPIDGNMLRCDGSVSVAAERRSGPAPPMAILWQNNSPFRHAVEQVVCSLTAAVVLVIFGTYLKRKGRRPVR